MARRSSITAIKRYRWQELGLFIIPFMILLLEMIQLLLARSLRTGVVQTSSLTVKNLPTIEGLIPVLGLIAVLLGINLLLSFTFPKADQVLLPLVGLLSGIGVLMATRLGPNLLPFPDPALGSRQLLWVIVGLVAFLVTLFGLRNMNWLRRYKYTWALLGIILVGITLAHSLRANLDSPTHDQLNIGPLNLQPSELLKIFLVIFFAAYLSENIDEFAGDDFRIGSLRLPFLPPAKILVTLLIMLGLALVLFLGIRELGLALLVYGIFLCMMYLGSGSIRYAVSGLVFFIILGFIGYALFGYVRARFDVLGFDIVNWQNWSAADQYFAENGGVQIVQGLIALSSGGIIGAGIGLGHPTFVPVVQSDMIFTALGEELGLAGLFAILGIYLFIIYRGYRIAMETTDTFSKLLASGLTSIFAIQTIIIIAGNMKILPLTGIPLPFLSYGGSSIIANFIIIGILLRISHNTAMERAGLA